MPLESVVPLWLPLENILVPLSLTPLDRPLELASTVPLQSISPFPADSR